MNLQRAPADVFQEASEQSCVTCIEKGTHGGAELEWSQANLEDYLPYNDVLLYCGVQLLGLASFCVCCAHSLQSSLQILDDAYKNEGRRLLQLKTSIC